LCQLVFGSSRFALHLPSGLAALLSVGCVYELGRELRDRRFGLFAALTLLLSAQFLAMTSVLTTDPLFASWMTLAWLAYFKHHKGRSPVWVWVFWAALGLAWLTKGPLALVLGALAVGSWKCIEGGIRAPFVELGRLKTLRGLALVLAINLPWHVMVWMRDPRFLEMFYVRINFRGLFDQNVNHPGPAWFYGPQVLVALMPWTLPATLVLGAAFWAYGVRAIRRRGWNLLAQPRVAWDPATADRLLLLCQLVFPLLFLSASSSKLGTYLLPLLPPLMLLVADGIWAFSAEPPKWFRRAYTAQAAILTVLFFAILFAKGRLKAAESIAPGGWPFLLGGLLALTVGACAAGVCVARRRTQVGVLWGGLGMFGLLALVFPALDRIAPNVNNEAIARTVAETLTPEDAVLVTQDLVQDFSIPWVLERRLAILGRTRELGMGHFTEVTDRDQALPDDLYNVRAENLPTNPWLYDWDRLLEEWNSPRQVWIFDKARPMEAKAIETQLIAAGCSVVKVGRVDKVYAISNHPLRP